MEFLLTLLRFIDLFAFHYYIIFLFQEQAQSVDFYTDGAIVAVGCLNGSWMVFDIQVREQLTQHTDGAEPIQVIKYSPDGNLLALGSRDNNIYIYQVNDDGRRYSRIGKCTVSHLNDKKIYCIGES